MSFPPCRVPFWVWFYSMSFHHVGFPFESGSTSVYFPKGKFSFQSVSPWGTFPMSVSLLSLIPHKVLYSCQTLFRVCFHSWNFLLVRFPFQSGSTRGNLLIPGSLLNLVQLKVPTSCQVTFWVWFHLSVLYSLLGLAPNKVLSPCQVHFWVRFHLSVVSPCHILFWLWFLSMYFHHGLPFESGSTSMYFPYVWVLSEPGPRFLPYARFFFFFCHSLLWIAHKPLRDIYFLYK